jgi:ABC-2 type transport system permease protein
MKTLWIAATNLRRTFRMRTNIFVIFIFPMLLILVLGAAFGGSSSPRLGGGLGAVWAARHRAGAPA